MAGDQVRQEIDLGSHPQPDGDSSGRAGLHHRGGHRLRELRGGPPRTRRSRRGDGRAGGGGDAGYVAALRARFGLDQPLWVQFQHYAFNLLRLDLGYSFKDNMPVAALIADKLAATAILMIASLGPPSCSGSASARSRRCWR